MSVPEVSSVPMEAPAGGGGPGFFREPGPAGMENGPAPGDAVPLDDSEAKTKVKATELNIAGDFAWSNPSVTEAEEVAELLAGRWSPQTADFMAVAGGTVAVAPTFGNFLGAILERPDGGISRLNLFSHSNTSMVAFGGHIEKRSVGHADVFLNVNGPSDTMTAMDPASMAAVAQPGVTFNAPRPIRGKTSFTADDVRKKFADAAVLVLYLCHSGQDAAFLKQVASFFKVRTIGFSDVVAYTPPAQTNPKRFKRAGERVSIGAGSTPVADFRALTGDARTIVANP